MLRDEVLMAVPFKAWQSEKGSAAGSGGFLTELDKAR
jgi:hypothetical protein